MDTCVWCRIFDDQSQMRIAEETMAFISILELAESGEVSITNSDVLEDEVEEILDFILEKTKCIEELIKEKGHSLKVGNPIDFIEEKK